MSDQDQVLRFSIEDKEYALNLDAVTPAFALEARTETGMSPAQAATLLGTAPDLDSLAAVMWMARRQAGEPRVIQSGRSTRRLWDAVTDGLTYAKFATLTATLDEAAEPDPLT